MSTITHQDTLDIARYMDQEDMEALHAEAETDYDWLVLAEKRLGLDGLEDLCAHCHNDTWARVLAALGY